MSEPRPDERSIHDELRTTASPADVYAAWADPSKLAEWFVDRAHGEARAGAVLTWIWDAFGLEAAYEVVAAEPGRRLVLRAPEGVAPPGLIELTIRRDGGETVLTLVNSGFLDSSDDLLEGVRSGWKLALALLREYLEHYAGRTRRAFIHLRPAAFDFAALQPWFTDGSCLRRWLTTSGEPAPAPAVFPLVLRDGTRVDATVIARTERELAMALRGEAAVLELKSFSAPPLEPGAPPQRIVALRGTSWHGDEARFVWLRELSEAALDALVPQL